MQRVINEMDREIQKKFEKTFDDINNQFQKYFKIIFNGGKADLLKTIIKSKTKKLLDEDNKENFLQENENSEIDDNFKDEQMGIDIMAVPPGKKISNLGMLSGGERTLTSLALLFAIISFNPPPFAILDEVEAALDEANSKRFGRILQQLSGKTQFILVTHNRQTMREASVLYGVTMNDDGASQLLSVKLDQVGEKGEIHNF